MWVNLLLSKILLKIINNIYIYHMSNSTVTPFFYGCIVIGPSGSGKTTFCLGL